MYKIKDFGIFLEKVLKRTNKPSVIGNLAFKEYHNNLPDVEKEVQDIAITLSSMEDGIEFEYSIDELHEIAKRLTEGDITVTRIGFDQKVNLKTSKT
ncbi:MAG: hypothetical protein COA94_03375 [Rickettsiales bacterium]|nr:MAG: hypothetical protein COA94_03375 [Rickettsiales bacterium]